MEQKYSFTVFANSPTKILFNGNNSYDIDNTHVYFATLLSSTPTIQIQVINNHITKTFSINAIQEDGFKTKNYTILAHNGSSFDVYLHDFHSEVENKKVVFSHNNSNFNVVITETWRDECCLYFDHVPCDYCYFDCCHDFSCHSLDPYFYLVCKNKSNLCFVIVIDQSKHKIVYHNQVNEYQFTNESITLMHEIHDHFHHAKVTKFTKSGMEEYFVYTSKTTKEEIEEPLIPYAFLQCIACKDFETAKSFLSKELSPTNEHLKTYFKDFQNIYYLSHHQDKIQYVLEYTDTFQKFTFLIKNKLIQNIS